MNIYIYTHIHKNTTSLLTIGDVKVQAKVYLNVFFAHVSNTSGGSQNIQRLQWSKCISNLMCLLLSTLHSSTILCCILQNPKTNVPFFSFCPRCKINVLVQFICRAIVLKFLNFSQQSTIVLSKSSLISD